MSINIRPVKVDDYIIRQYYKVKKIRITSVHIMSTDKQAEFMTYCTFTLFILEVLVFIYSIKAVHKYVKLKKN